VRGFGVPRLRISRSPSDDSDERVVKLKFWLPPSGLNPAATGVRAGAPGFGPVVKARAGGRSGPTVL
jgi:hypothetical protein